MATAASARGALALLAGSVSAGSFAGLARGPFLRAGRSRLGAGMCARSAPPADTPAAPDRPPSQLSVTPATPGDLRVLEERQLGHRMTNVAGVGCRCVHGFAQAFAFDPLLRPEKVIGASKQDRSKKTRLESGLFRLSCPLLVKAVDEWEAEGAVAGINAEIRAGAGLPALTWNGQGGDTGAGAGATGDGGRPGAAAARAAAAAAARGAGGLMGALDEAHAAHSAARRELIGDRLPALLAEAAADGPVQTQTANLVLDSGIAGQTRSKVDVKCLHAQLADHLCRGESNGVGAHLIERLTARGVETRGTAACRAQCDLRVPESEARATWWYEPEKNHWKIRKKLRRRKAEKVAQYSKGVDGACDDECEQREQDERRSY